MAYAIIEGCTKDALCVDACTVDCIHPTPGEPGFDSAEQLFVNPDDCIDCGACIPVCPASTIFPVEEVPADKAEFIAKNAQYYVN